MPRFDRSAQAPARVDAIQALRAAAALMVVAAHAIGTVIDHGGGPGAFFPAFPNLARIGYSGVDLFFVISGFVMAHTLVEPRGVARFAAARFVRIWPLYALATLAALPFCDVSGIDWRTVVTSIALVPLADGVDYHLPLLTVGWTLGVEAVFYLLVAAAIAARGTARLLLGLTLAAAVTGMVVTPAWAPFRMLASPLVGEFALGIAVWIAWRAGVARGRALAIVLGSLILWGEIIQILPARVAMDPALTAAGQQGLSRVIAWGLPWALVTYGVVAGPAGVVTRSRAVQATGNASYSIYLVHLTVIQAMMTAGAPTVTTAHAWIAALFVAPVVAGLAAHRMVERPLLHWLRRSSIERRGEYPANLVLALR